MNIPKTLFKLCLLTGIGTLAGCATWGQSDSGEQPSHIQTTGASTSQVTQAGSGVDSTCPGNSLPPGELVANLQQVADPDLLAKAAGEPGLGGLCDGAVYQVLKPFTLYRAWNSTNAESELGKWWAFFKPDGAVAQYRKEYNICYQWTPLDMMTECTIKADTKIVIGPGQSAKCSQWVTHNVSAKKQVYLPDAAQHMSNCRTYRNFFDWRQ